MEVNSHSQIYIMSFPIFIENEGLNVPIEKKIMFASFLVLMLCFLLAIIFEAAFLLENFFNIFFALFFVSILVTISSMFRLDYLHGEIKGTLIFEKEALSIAENTIPLLNIESMHLMCGDYYMMKRIFESRSFFEFYKRGFSRGLENKLEITLKDKEKIYVSFQQLKKNQVLDIREMLIHYHKSQVISWLHLLEILKIDDYSEIQKFKIEIGKV